jgi:hypothetical protein
MLSVLAKHLSMNSTTWRALQAAGVNEQTELKLDFFFNAPNESQANQVAEFLRMETDYTVSTAALSTDGLKSEVWRVTGQTRSTTVSEEILNQWTKWMIVAGFQNGDCEFDGWGALAPK